MRCPSCGASLVPNPRKVRTRQRAASQRGLLPGVPNVIAAPASYRSAPCPRCGADVELKGQRQAAAAAGPHYGYKD